MRKIMFAENLKELRTAKGLTQAELAALVGVDQRTVSAWENKVSEPGFEMLARLCDVFDESIDEMLT